MLHHQGSVIDLTASPRTSEASFRRPCCAAVADHLALPPLPLRSTSSTSSPTCTFATNRFELFLETTRNLRRLDS
ncbi:hypothetical protein HYQ45_003423 [Verticillium longisporum]|uniref:Uncharacterized protein n=2 Tax=Verticillium TaxID=1036719 RepID=A0A8I3AU33_VERLO|nr:hypothetical protein HYQ44_006781 [Verticillium longisporum]KAG7139607.1 hypothetical protein HYQ45_003423 [Verticillium longisporum]RXG49107.1 hypothetical protein VDGE_30640 [Verticillium dahliae]